MFIVKEISTSIVRATIHTQNKIDLTPWDLQTLLMPYIQRGFLFHKPPSRLQAENADALNHLLTSLSRTLDFFPPLSGRLETSKDGKKQSFCIDCNNEGALFTRAIAPGVKLSDILEPEYVPVGALCSFFRLNGVRNFEGTSNPLLAVQVTELDDGYFIACSVNHSVLDGTSFFHFMNSWAEISRGSNSPSKLPSLERWFPEGVSRPIYIPFFDDQATSHDKSVDPLSLEIELLHKFFHFSKANISKLKLKIIFGIDKSGNASGVIISSSQAIVAHLWRSVTRCRGLDEDQETEMKMPGGARHRLRPPLPEGYFGNCVNPIGFTMTARNLLSRDGLSWAATQLRRVVANQTPEEAKKFYEDWLKQPRFIKNIGEHMTKNNFVLMSSSPRFDMYGNDFGWGKPVGVRAGPSNRFDGKMSFSPGVEEGSINVEMSLSKDTMSALEKDLEFMEFADELKR